MTVVASISIGWSWTRNRTNFLITLMRPSPFHSHRIRAFTLVELLVVMGIMSILVVLSTLALRGINNSGQFNRAVSEISGTLDQARAYAIAQDTYVWVVLYENTPVNNAPLEVYVGTFASSDGTDPFNWTGSVSLPTPGIVASTTLTQITRISHYKGLHLQTTTLPNVSSNPNFPATGTSIPNFQCTVQSDSGPLTLSNTSTVYWLIQFTPTGAARNGANPISAIWFGLQPSYSQTALDLHNIASLEVNGVTGMTTTYRQ